MEETWTRFWNDLIGRETGPMTFRIILQPLMALLLATRDGIKDARAGHPPYFWAIFTHPNERKRLLAEGVSSVLRILLIGVVMDLIYQVMVFRRVYLDELAAAVFTLAFLPYLLFRGPVNRVAKRWIGTPTSAAR